MKVQVASMNLAAERATAISGFPILVLYLRHEAIALRWALVSANLEGRSAGFPRGYLSLTAHYTLSAYSSMRSAISLFEIHCASLEFREASEIICSTGNGSTSWMVDFPSSNGSDASRSRLRIGTRIILCAHVSCIS